MVEAFYVNIKGLDELQKQLERVSREVSKKILRTVLRKASLIIQQAMVDLAPKDTGFLSQHFGIRVKVLKQDVAAISYIGPEGKIDYPDIAGGYRQKVNRKGKKYQVGRISVVSVARFLEYGTRFEGKKPFMTQAFEAHKEEVLQVIIDGIRQALEETAK